MYYVLTKDYKIKPAKATIVLGKSGDRLYRCWYYTSDFRFKIDAPSRDTPDIDLHYQFSVFNLDRPLSKLQENKKVWNANSFVVKADDVYKIEDTDFKRKKIDEISRRFDLSETEYISPEEREVSDYFVDSKKLYLIEDDFSIENGKYILAKRGDVVISTGSYSNLTQFEVVSASNRIDNTKIINNGVFVVDKDKVLPIPVSYYMPIETRGKYWDFALDRLTYHINNVSELRQRSQELDQSMEEHFLKDEIRGYGPINTGDENKDFWLNAARDSGFDRGNLDAFFDAQD